MRNRAGTTTDATGVCDKPALRLVGENDPFRHAPSDVVIEQALLGTIEVRTKALELVRPSLLPEHFFDPLHQRIYRQMLVMPGVIDPLTLAAALKNDPAWPELQCEPHAYLGNLALGCAPLNKLVDYAGILRELARRRALLRISEALADAAHAGPSTPISESLQKVEHELRSISSSANDIPTACLSASEWCRRDIPPVDRLVGDLLSTTSRLMLVAQTGIGKTNFMLARAFCLANGSDFLHWRGSRPAKVLFIDGEMSRRLMRTRIADAARRHRSLPENLFILCRDDFQDMPPLNTIEGQAFIDRQIEKLGGIDFIIFDNVQSLLIGDMKDEESWQQTLPWIKALTSRNIGQIWVHHTGLNTSRSYGTSTREWQLDTVAVMEKVERADTDIAFTLKFPKARERAPHNREDFAEVVVTLIDDQWRSEPCASEKMKPVALTAGESGWLRDLVSIFAEHGSPIQTLSPASGMTPQKTLPRDHVRERFKQKGRFTQTPDGALTGNDRQKMSAALNALKDKGKIGMTDRLVWLLQERQ